MATVGVKGLTVEKKQLKALIARLILTFHD